MPTAVVTGANSGIGHAFAKILVKEGYDVYAADVNIGTPIKGLGCNVVQLDVTSESSIKQLKDQLQDQTVDLLLNVAGIVAPGFPDSDSFESANLEAFEKVFRVNTFGPMLLTQALLPNLIKSKTPKVGMVSSRVGSIGDNTSGGSYAYRASKAALNSISKSMSVDLKEKNVAVIILHPGITYSGIVPTQREIPGAGFPDEAAGKLWKVLVSKGIEESGTFWHRDGYELPW